MAEFASVPELAIQDPQIEHSQRHSALVRVTHWIHLLVFFALVISGIGILLAHTRFYWGEAGGEGAPSLFDLPLRLHRDGVSNWGRGVHFLSAWIAVSNGFIYLVSGLVSRHFRTHLLPTKSSLSWKSVSKVLSDHLQFRRPTPEESFTYNVLQRTAYLTVIFLLFPLIVLTGLAMSPAITAALPTLVSVFGGQQSARTIHFFLANLLVLFVLVHIGMVTLAGFRDRVGAMTTGRSAPKWSPP